MATGYLKVRCVTFNKQLIKMAFLWSGENRGIELSWFPGEFWPKLKQCLTDWTKEALPQSFRTRGFWLFPAFVLRHFLSHCCATSSRSLSDRELSAGEVPLDLAEFCHVVVLAPLHMQKNIFLFCLTRQKQYWSYFAFSQIRLVEGKIVSVVLLPHKAK